MRVNADDVGKVIGRSGTATALRTVIGALAGDQGASTSSMLTDSLAAAWWPSPLTSANAHERSERWPPLASSDHVRGEVAVELRTDEPERRFAPGQVLREEGGTRLHGEVGSRSLRPAAGEVAELLDRAGAEAARGTLLIAAVEPDEQPAEHGEFYDRQLIGLRATTPTAPRSAGWDRCCTCRARCLGD